MSSEQGEVLTIVRPNSPLFVEVPGDGSLLRRVQKSESITQSNTPRGLGRQPWPFNIDAVEYLRDLNEHHSTCLETTASALVGLGFLTEEEKAVLRRMSQEAMTGSPAPAPVAKADGAEPRESKVDRVLDPLCRGSWQETIYDVADDFTEKSMGFLEVVRGNAGEITGLYHLPARRVHVFIEDRKGNYHYEIDPEPGDMTSTGDSGHRRFAVFGEKDRLIAAAAAGFEASSSSPTQLDPETVSEVIVFRRPSARSRWYSRPHWLSATASIELSQNLKQYANDFFVNRGVPEFMLFFLGQQVENENWKKITSVLQQSVGVGNSHRSVVVNMPEWQGGEAEGKKIELMKLAMESSKEDDFGEKSEQLALAIVSAHRVPPLLAGIQIPGKLGATNELPNAIMAFQLLVVGPYQRVFEQTLGKTLGAEGLGLSREDFRLRRITEEIDVSAMDTVARMRQTPMQARSEGRDLKSGVKE